MISIGFISPIKEKTLFFFIIFSFSSEFVYLQPLSKNHFDYKSKIILHDSGMYWDDLSTINSIRDTINSLNTHNDSIFFNKKYHVYFNSKSKLYASCYLSFKKYYYIYFDEIGRSGFGFQNHWVTLQISRDSENWGAGNNIDLALSNKSPSYDYILISSDYGNIRVNYIHGFLENITSNTNRFINARGIEWTNNKSIIIGLSEIIIYSGENRSLDIGYLNPIASHLELELNNRLNRIGDHLANAVWQLHLDIYLKSRSRFSLNLLFDEFVLDPKIEIGKEHGKAFSMRYSFNALQNKKRILNLFVNTIKVGTPTFRHGNGSNNFINNNKPLGWHYGSDAQNINIGLNYLIPKKLIFNLQLGILEKGSESILSRPYEPYLDYQKSVFPTSPTTQILYINSEIHWKIRDFLSLTNKNQFNYIENYQREMHFSFGFIYSYF